MGRKLATAGFGDGIDIGQVRRVHQHHVGAVRCQGPSGDWSGQHPREVEHAHPVQGAIRCHQRDQRARRRVADAFDADQGQTGHRFALRVLVPFTEAAHGGNYQVGLGRCLLEVFGGPRLQGGFDIGALRQFLARTAEQTQHTGAVVVKVGVNAHPAAAAFGPAGVQTGKLVPGRGNPPIQAEPAAAFQRRFPHVHRNRLPGLAALVA